jgi:hypothetical protein
MSRFQITSAERPALVTPEGSSQPPSAMNIMSFERLENRIRGLEKALLLSAFADNRAKESVSVELDGSSTFVGQIFKGTFLLFLVVGSLSLINLKWIAEQGDMVRGILEPIVVPLKEGAAAVIEEMRRYSRAQPKTLTEKLANFVIEVLEYLTVMVVTELSWKSVKFIQA